MTDYSDLSDDFYVNMHLNTEMDIPQSRDSVLHFFEQVQKRIPNLRNFYARERGEYVLEEDKDRPGYRWVSVEARRICSWYVNPPTVEAAMEQHKVILDLIPFSLSVSHLDCESLNLTFGFDFVYRGNHNQLLAEALGVYPAFERLAGIPGASLLSQEPSIQLALDDECRTQCRVAFESRTTPQQIRSRDFAEEPLSVYLTVRRFDSLSSGETFQGEIERLADVSKDLLDTYVIENILRPLQQSIGMR